MTTKHFTFEDRIEAKLDKLDAGINAKLDTLVARIDQMMLAFHRYTGGSWYIERLKQAPVQAAEMDER